MNQSIDKTIHAAITNPSTMGLDYKLVFTEAPERYVLFAVDDPHFTIVDLNKSHAAMTGVPRSSVIGHPMLDAFPDTSEKYLTTGISDLQESLRRVVRTGKPDTLEAFRYDIRQSDGSYKEHYWRPQHFPIRAKKSGPVLFVLQSSSDITHEVRTARKLHDTENQLENALSVGLVGTWQWDIVRDVVTADANLARMFGVSTTLAASGMPLSMFTGAIHPDDQQRVQAEIAQTLATRGAYESEYRVIGANKKVSWVIARGRVELNPLSKKPAAFPGILIDITERKLAEQHFAAEQRFRQRMAESITDAIISVDVNGILTSWNRGAERLFGYASSEAIGAQSTDILEIDPRYDRYKIRQAAIKNGSWKGSLRYKHKDGSDIEVIASVSSLADPDNNGPDNEGLVIIFQESTEITRIQADYENARIKEHRALLQAKTLKKRNDELTTLNRTKDEFIAIASHQLRTPATGVKQYIGMMLQGFADPMTEHNKALLEQAYASNERQLQIVDDILRVAQIDMNKITLMRTQCDLIAFIRGIIDEQHDSFALRDHKIDLHVSPDVVMADIDVERLRMAIGNIIDNANKYTPDGKSIGVSVACDPMTDPANVYITVADQGVGIAKADRAKLFQKFSRINNPLSVQVGGNGLGLYWSKKIIDLHGGDITVTSRLNRGTTFTIRIPI